MSFYKQQSSNTRVLKSVLWLVSHKSVTPEDKQTLPPSWSVSERGNIASPGTNETEGTIALSHSLSLGQRHLLRAANLDSGFLLCFTLNSKLQCM